jgi:hypothetical protein
VEDNVSPEQVRTAFRDVAEGKVDPPLVEMLIGAIRDGIGFTRIVNSGVFD